MAMLIYRLGKMHREVFRSLFFFLAAVEMVSYAIFGVFCNGTVGRSTYLDEQIAYEKTTERQEGRQGSYMIMEMDEEGDLKFEQKFL